MNASKVRENSNGFKLVGNVFTFFIDPNSNDKVGQPDAAMAALEIAPVPLPAGGLLRRKQKAARLANA